MTNFEYITKNLTERDIASLLISIYTFPEFSSFVHKVYHAWEKWALSVSPNAGNMAKGCKSGKRTIKDNPSIWFWENWHMPNGEWEKKGRPRNVSMQVWLSLQYNPKDWEETT